MALHKHKREVELKVEIELLKSLSNFKSNADYLFVKHQSRLVKLNMNEIYFVEALKDYVQVNTKDFRYTIHATMKDVEKKLPLRVFQRIHRSFIVNMDKIEAISGGNIVMQDTHKEIPVGGNYRDELSDRINVL
jgi:DNA-binding LytR/AlgR family response regulator